MKVLLIADVGLNENGYYHVGDEAMFYQTYSWYKKTIKDVQIVALSRSKSHNQLDLKEYIHLLFPMKDWQARRYYLCLMIRSVVGKYLRTVGLNKDELNFINVLRSQDVIHFSGGGNLYSIYVPWLYYAFFVIFIGRLYGKQIVLTSQTIGPLGTIDRMLASIFLNMTNLVGVREPDSRAASRKYALRTKVVSMLDTAFDLAKSDSKLASTKKLRIGISLHSLPGVGDFTINTLTQCLRILQNEFDFELVLIPHIFQKRNDHWGVGYMDRIDGELAGKIKIMKPTYLEIMRTSDEPSRFIKDLTSKMDFMFTTRYHGLIFSLSESVSSIALASGEYYKHKNVKALEFWYGRAYSDYIVDLDEKGSLADMTEKAKRILSNLTKHRDFLEKQNGLLKKDTKFFYLDQLPAEMEWKID